MSELCKNCETEIALNFCGNCGQKKLKRIDRSYLKDELQYTLIHTNKGFFYSLKELVKNPGKTAKEYIDGKRVSHYKPLALVFILAGIYAFLNHTVVNVTEVTQSFGPQTKGIEDYNHLVMKYYSFIVMTFIPFMALITWLVFKKWGYNYYENVVINAYYQALTFVFSIVFIMPPMYFLSNNPIWLMAVFFLTVILFAGLHLWFYRGLYPQQSIGDIIIRSLVLFAIGFVIFIIISIIVAVVQIMIYGLPAVPH